MKTATSRGPGLQLKTLHLEEGIDAILRMLKHMTEGVEIVCDFAWTAPILADPQLLDQVVMNLVANAVHATKETPAAKILIATRRVGEEVEIRVCDNGPGIAKEDMEKVFAPFYTTKPPGEGTGLGLALSRERVARSGGSLELVFDGAGGADFRVRIPHLPLDRRDGECV